jgi:hypothetical protein
MGITPVCDETPLLERIPTLDKHLGKRIHKDGLKNRRCVLYGTQIKANELA